MDINTLINDFSEQLAFGTGILFVGSGISAPSSLPTWNKLLKRFAQSIDLEIENADNLPQIAQFIVNSNGSNRGPLIHSIKQELIRRFPINDYHKHLQRMNVKTIWTTNYDTLLEDTYRGLIQNVMAHDDAISRSVPNHQIEIIKMHGCISSSHIDDIVITIEDYEDFFINRPATAERLRTDLLQNSFLFIGYSYRDPNIKNMMVEVRRLSSKAPRQHYMILKSATDPKEQVRQQHWIDDLRRIGIACVLIPEFDCLDLALKSISLKSRGKTLFVTGSHQTQSPNFLNPFGQELAKCHHLIILDGQSEGVSRKVISAYTEACLKERLDIRSRIEIFPNPYSIKEEFDNNPSLIPELKQWRTPLLRKAHIVVAFDGAIGTKAELEVARDMGCFIIPVPQQENDLPSKLLTEFHIKKQLEQKIPDYLRKAQSREVTPELLATSIKQVLAS